MTMHPRIEWSMLSAVTGRVLAAAAIIVLGACAASQEGPSRGQLIWPAPPEEPRYIHEKTVVGSSDVTAETATERLRRVATGDTSHGKGLDKPFGVAVSNGRVFVGDTVGRKIAAYDFVEKRYFEFGVTGDGKVSKPLGMATDQKGDLFVVDGTSQRVLIYDRNGNFKSAIGGSKVFERPSGVAVNDAGNRIYVVDTGGVTSDAHRVRVFDNTGKHLFDFGSRGNKVGQFNLPNMATVDSKGNVYVVDGGNFRIEKFSADGKFLATFGTVGRQSGQFSRPKGIAVDNEGKIFVVDAAFGNFQIFDAKGKLLMYVGQRSQTGAAAEFMLPSGIAVDNDGRVYVVDQFFRKIEIFRPANMPEARVAGRRTSK